MLKKGEKILEKCEVKAPLGININWYATSKRIIRQQDGILDRTDEAPYNNIISVKLQSGPSKDELIFGIGIASIGFVIFLVFGNITWLGFTVISIIYLINSYFSKQAYYQFSGKGIDESRWKIPISTSSGDIKKFVEEVKHHLNN